MRICIIKLATAFVAAAIIGACGSSDATSAPAVPSEPIVPRPTVPTPPPPPPILAIYDRIATSSYAGMTRYVLYRDSSFALEYALEYGGSFSLRYPGRFTRADSVVQFNFTNPGGPTWAATAIVRGDAMAVRYNPIMLFADFEDGDYLLEH